MEQRSSLSPGVSSAAQARWITRALLSAWDLTDVEELTCLLVTELVANAVVHTATAPQLTISLQDGCLHVGVGDHDPRPPVLRDGSPWASAGRGLALVDTLADDWGWEPEAGGGGKTVWFDLRTGGAGAEAWRDVSRSASSG